MHECMNALMHVCMYACMHVLLAVLLAEGCSSPQELEKSNFYSEDKKEFDLKNDTNLI